MDFALLARVDQLEKDVAELKDKKENPFAMAVLQGRGPGRQPTCKCPERIELIKPEDAVGFDAWEAWCPKHGYQNDCWICDGQQNGVAYGTEVCIAHGRGHTA